jgi:hypothetical protein
MQKLLLIAFIACIMGCTRHPVMPGSASVKFWLEYSADEHRLQFDSIRFLNEAGNNFSVTKIEYYISELTLYNLNGSKFKVNDVFYVNAKDTVNKFIRIDSLPPGNYKGISFNIGVPEEKNKSGALAPTLQNMNMAWPEQMGGGYHFLKLEGHFIKDSNTSGYAVHLGKNENLVKIYIDYPFELKFRNHQWQLQMNVNEWFKNPYTYNFTDGSYTMNVDSLMKKLTANAATVFSIGTGCH